MDNHLIYLGKRNNLILSKDKLQVVVNNQLVGCINPKNIILKDNSFYVDLKHISVSLVAKRLLSTRNKASSKHTAKHIDNRGRLINKITGVNFNLK